MTAKYGTTNNSLKSIQEVLIFYLGSANTI